MLVSAEMPEIVTWPGLHGPLHIDCSREAAEQIRRRAVAGLKALPGTGLGVGGLLLGEREGRSLRVLDSIDLPCSHSLGPTFRLTPPEIKEGRRLILADGALPVVGWYFSRTRGELELSRAEVALFEELFPSQWQIRLLMLPDESGSVRAAFFFRDPAGEFVKVAGETLQPWVPDPPQILPAPQEKPAGSKLSWVLTALLALAAGAALFMFQNSTASKPRPAPVTQIP